MFLKKKINEKKDVVEEIVHNSHRTSGMTQHTGTESGWSVFVKSLYKFSVVKCQLHVLVGFLSQSS